MLTVAGCFQLVVVGDQSSGKSSLLEGLTGLAFPIASDLCTRFATQIVLRRTPAEEANVKVSIIPGPEAMNNDHLKGYLAGFKHTSSNAEFDSEEFAGLLGSVSFSRDECFSMGRLNINLT